MNTLLNNAVIFTGIIGAAYSLWLGDELFALAYFLNVLTTLSLYSTQHLRAVSKSKNDMKKNRKKRILAKRPAEEKAVRTTSRHGGAK